MRCLPSICLPHLTQSSFHDARFAGFRRFLGSSIWSGTNLNTLPVLLFDSVNGVGNVFADLPGKDSSPLLGIPRLRNLGALLKRLCATCSANGPIDFRQIPALCAIS
jgi:hypothetical protein